MVIPINDFENFYVYEDNSVVLQSGNIIYHMDSKEQSIKKIIEDGNLMGFYPSDNKILYYKGSEIYEYNLSDGTTAKKYL